MKQKIKMHEKPKIKTIDMKQVGTQKMKKALFDVTDNSNSENNENANEYGDKVITNAVNKTVNINSNYIKKAGKEAVSNAKTTVTNQVEQLKNKKAIEKIIDNKTTENSSAIKKKNPITIKKHINQTNKIRAKSIKKNDLKIKVPENALIKQIPDKNKILTQKINKLIIKSIKNTRRMIKRILKAIKLSIKAIIKAFNLLLGALTGGLWIFVTIIIIICIIGMLASSVYGIFFTGEDIGEKQYTTISQLIQDLNQEYIDKINKIQQENPYKEYDITGEKASWQDVIAVYTVKLSGGNNQQEVITMNEERANFFKEIFWKMNEVTFTKDEKSHEQLQVGWTSSEVVTVTEVYLHIQINSKTAEQMAEEYQFTDAQKQQLQELKNSKYDDMWSAVIYGNRAGNSDIVEVASKQIGNIGGEKFWRWYGFNSRVAWCACFVSWCADQCGYIQAGIIPKFSICQTEGIEWFKTCNQWKERGYVPQAGDIIFFDWADKSTGVRDGSSDHVGIVEYVEDGKVHTIEGNTTDSCARRSYNLDSEDILGYGIPKYPEKK